MKIGIIYEKNNGVNESLFLSLSQMITNLGFGFVFINYIDSIALNPNAYSFWNQLKHNIKINKLDFTSYQFRTKKTIIRHLKGCDAVVKMNVLPDAFIVEEFDVIDYIRTELEIPILSYSNYFFGNRSLWPFWLTKMTAKISGFDRYDYYLCSGEEPWFSLPKGINHPYSVIGFNSQGLGLSANRKNEKPVVVVDFPQPGFEELREFQLSVLNDIGCEYIVLDKKMCRKDLYEIYEKSHILFISSNESFGVSILEFQLAGGIVFTLPNFLPYYLKSDKKYGKNIITYSIENKAELIDKLNESFSTFNSNFNQNNFFLDYPDYYFGNMSNLGQVFDRIKKGEINVNSHLEYEGMELLYADNTKGDVYKNFPQLIDKLEKYDV